MRETCHTFFGVAPSLNISGHSCAKSHKNVAIGCSLLMQLSFSCTITISYWVNKKQSLLIHLVNMACACVLSLGKSKSAPTVRQGFQRVAIQMMENPTLAMKGPHDKYLQTWLYLLDFAMTEDYKKWFWVFTVMPLLWVWSNPDTFPLPLPSALWLPPPLIQPLPLLYPSISCLQFPSSSLLQLNQEKIGWCRFLGLTMLPTLTLLV